MASISKSDFAAAVKRARDMMAAGMSGPVTKRQRETTADREAKGPSWVSRVILPAPPEDDVRQIICDAVSALGVGDEKYTIPTIEHVHAQWTGFRAGVPKMEPESLASEAEKFDCLMREVSSPITLLYAYGGAHFINGPATRRSTCTKLAELTKGRCLTVQPRLAPQNPFPAGLLDLLVVYMSLLYPQPSSFHEPVPASHLVFAGDSSGAQLELSLIQVILAARKRQCTNRPTLRFHGRNVELPMPAGVAVQSPGLDHHGSSLPSWYANRDYDIFVDAMPGYLPGFPTDDAWPTNPPRGNYYCETSMLCHPLVSPLAAKSWRGAPPMYIAIGSRERKSDSTKVPAQLAARQNVPVIWDEYELMPHNWPMVFSKYPHSIKLYHSWSAACLRFLRGDKFQTTGAFTEFESLSTREIDVHNLTPLTLDEVEYLMRTMQRSVRPFTGELVAKSLL